MKSIFISQPMHGLEESDILVTRQNIINAAKENLPKDGEGLYFLDSFLTGAKDVNPLVCLGHAITMLSKADIAIFAHGWSKSRGCRIEHAICEEYGITCYQAIPGKKGWIFTKEDNYPF